jgi:hypothetical protein
MEFELDKTYGIEFARLEPHEQHYVREHIGPNFPLEIPVDELNIFEDAFRRKARQVDTAFDALRESNQLGARSQDAFVLRGLASVVQGSLGDISRYREGRREIAARRRKQAFAEMGEEESTPPDNVS